MWKLILLVLALGQGEPQAHSRDWPIAFDDRRACEEVGSTAVRHPQAYLTDDQGRKRPYIVLAYRCEEVPRA